MKKKQAQSFAEHTETLRAQLEHAKQELVELEQQLEQHDDHTRSWREAMKKWRDMNAGKYVESASSRGRSKIARLSINPETNRPKRGKRRQQIRSICKKLGRGKRVFRTVDVLNELRHIEHDISDGTKSYMYAVMTSLEKGGFLEKIGRGTWKLK